MEWRCGFPATGHARPPGEDRLGGDDQPSCPAAKLARDRDAGWHVNVTEQPPVERAEQLRAGQRVVRERNGADEDVVGWAPR
jgi:hypothetical protein